MRTLAELLADGDLRGKRVLVRSDLNVPLDGQTITDDGRIKASVPAIEALAEAGATVVVCAHLGRPKGAPEDKYSLAPGRRAARRAARPGRSPSPPTRWGSRPRPRSRPPDRGDVVLLENLRFNPGETTKDDGRARRLRRGSSPRSPTSSSPTGSASCTASRRPCTTSPASCRTRPGGLVSTEVDVLERLTKSPERPYAVVLGGAKVSDKLGVIGNLLGTADRLLIGGGMVFTFLKAQGHEVGKSLLEEDQVDTVRGYLDEAEAKGVEIVLPVDIVAATEFSADADHEVVAADAIPADRIGVDIGPKSSELFAEKLSDTRTVFWNGPMGAFEMAPYAAGTKALAEALVEVTAKGALTVVGGGDSAAAVRQLGFSDDQFGHISTGGGASLEYLEGKELPGLTVLEESD